MVKLAKLTPKQQRFVDAYDGDLKKAAKDAGISYSHARTLSTKKHITEAIRNRVNTVAKGRIMTREERQAWWTKIMNDSEQTTKDRLKASELLGKSECDFVQKHKLVGENDGPIEIIFNPVRPK